MNIKNNKESEFLLQGVVVNLEHLIAMETMLWIFDLKRKGYSNDLFVMRTLWHSLCYEQSVRTIMVFLPLLHNLLCMTFMGLIGVCIIG